MTNLYKKEDSNIEFKFELYFDGIFVGYEFHTKNDGGNIFHASVTPEGPEENSGAYGTSIVVEGEKYFIAYDEKKLVSH